MGWKKVDESPAPSGNFARGVKFEVIGQKYLGRVLRKEQQIAKYNDGDKEVTAYIFRGNLPNPQTGADELTEFSVVPPHNLKDRLERAEKAGDLLFGTLCEMHYTGTRPITGRPDPMKIIELQVNNDKLPERKPLEHKPLPAPKPQANQGNTRNIPPPGDEWSSGGPRGGFDDDIPF